MQLKPGSLKTTKFCWRCNINLLSMHAVTVYIGLLGKALATCWTALSKNRNTPYIYLDVSKTEQRKKQTRCKFQHMVGMLLGTPSECPSYYLSLPTRDKCVGEHASYTTFEIWSMNINNVFHQTTDLCLMPSSIATWSQLSFLWIFFTRAI